MYSNVLLTGVNVMDRNDGFYTPEELRELGVKDFGGNVKISRKASLYMPEKIRFGHDIRIDDFCILVGDISIGNYVHICAFTGLHASSGSIRLDDFSNISSRVAIYAASDDYSGASMTNSVIPDDFKQIQYSDIYIGKHVVVGTGSTILPGASIPEGIAIGAMGLVKEVLQPWGIYAGIPCKRVKERQKALLALEKEFLKGKMTRIIRNGERK